MTMNAQNDDVWIQTALGGRIDLINPKVAQVGIFDIAHALSNICRFGGHCKWHYSVAQHSVLVSHLVPADQALEALMHDAAEAYLGDIVRPLKIYGQMEAYRAAEKEMEKVIAQRFLLANVNTPEIKAADVAMLAKERQVLLKDQDTYWDILEGVTPAAVTINKITPEQAKKFFLDRFVSLMSKRVSSAPAA